MADLHRRRSSPSTIFTPGIFTSSRNTIAIEFTIASPRFTIAIATPPFKAQLLDSLSESHLDSQLQLQLLHSTSQFLNSQSHLFSSVNGVQFFRLLNSICLGYFHFRAESILLLVKNMVSNFLGYFLC
jgi:hypothetical protein